MLVQTEFPEDIIFLPFRIPIFVKHYKFLEQVHVEIALADYIEQRILKQKEEQNVRNYVA